MLLAGLAVALLSVLPTYASREPVRDISSRHTCSSSLDAHKKCALGPDTDAPIYWLCNAEDHTWEPTNERCDFGHDEDAEPPLTDGDWHIGCDDPAHCGFYQDHSNKRSIKSNLDTVTDSTREESSHRKPDWSGIPDREGIETRCSLSSTDLIEMFDGKHWVHFYKCPPSTACSYILGSGACKASDHDFVIPGRSNLWAFHCPNASKDTSTCLLAGSIREAGFSEPYEPYFVGTTRCDPAGRAVQYLDDNTWRNIYPCKAEASCVEHGGRGGCQTGQTLSYPLTTRSLPDRRQATTSGPIQWSALQRNAKDQPPTRCNPETNGHVQFFSEWYHKWIDFHTCQYEGGCHNWKGEARCHDEHEILVPFVELPNGVNGWHPLKDSERPSGPVVEAEKGNNVEFPQKIATTQGPIQTRCEPLDQTFRFVQYLHPTAQQWLRFYQCSGRCFQFPDYAACEEQRDKYVIPSPPRQNVLKRAARPIVDPSVKPLEHGNWGSRCDTLRKSGVNSFYSGKLVAFGECPNNGPCREAGAGIAVCDVNGHPYSMEAHGQTDHLPHQDLRMTDAPNLQIFDTRCNPRDLSEVQRHNGTAWVHHFQCTISGSCINTNGRGACRLQNTVDELPSANPSSVKEGKPIDPTQIRTRCTVSNATEVLQWTQSQSWEPRGVCLPPYECYDFAGAAGFALCARPDAQHKKIWLPWPALSRSMNGGQVTRCKDQNTLEQFKDNAWVPYRRCHGIFNCQAVEGGPNGGCAAPSLYDILTHASMDNASRVTTPRLPKRKETDDSLSRDSERLSEHSGILISEGGGLMAPNDLLGEALFHSRNLARSFEDFAAMEDFAVDHYPSYISKPDKSQDTALPNTSLVPTTTDRPIHRRDIDSLTDDTDDNFDVTHDATTRHEDTDSDTEW